MKSFLEYVAEDIYHKYGSDMSRIAVVFPNKRASLFMNEYLARLTDKPIWSPAYITISDLFRQHSQRSVADPIKLVCDLHRSFITQTGIDETLDHFYSWGQLLLSDFDDIDKNMADADKIFQNLQDIHELDDISYLTDQQKEAIRRFFSNFSTDHNSLLKERFLQLWSKMGAIYHDFNQRLAQQSLAYEGALYREVVSTQLSSLDDHYDHYLFVGFNMLQKVEQQLFLSLKKQGKAKFYWDFDKSYLSDNEAGHFIQDYLNDFPNEFDTESDEIYNQYQSAKEITFTSSTTENAQARYVSQWLKDKQRHTHGRKTAIVMCDESLLSMVVHSIPDEVDKINITTGFPLIQSPVASLITQLTNLFILGYNHQRQLFIRRYLDPVMRHPYMVQLPKDETEQLLAKPDNLLPWLCTILQRLAQLKDIEDPLYQESIFRSYTLINRLQGLVACGDLVVDVTTLQRLITQLIQSTTIPFHGEPAEGIQIMGVLETRNLDFDHLILLSCNEGNMPKGVNDTSFIPYSIRKAYGLTTIDHKVSIYSYYYHRLLQRASDITILYNNSTTDGKTGEMSRFMLQMMIEDQHHSIQMNTLQVLSNSIQSTPSPVSVPQKKLMASLSPTAINTYMRCPLRYYYKYECNLSEPELDDDDTIDNRAFGNIFHEASQILYEKMMARSQQILANDIDDLLKKGVEIERAVDTAMQKELAHQSNLTSGIHIINREVIIHYLRQLLQIDKKLTPFRIIGLECDVHATISTPHITTSIGGRIDRLDCIMKDGKETIRVIDYKTGSYQPRALADVDAIFQQENLKNHSDYYLQTLLYAQLVKARYPNTPVAPALLFIQHAGGDDYDPTLCFGSQKIKDIAEHSQRFQELLEEKIDEIFNPDIAFLPTEEVQRCQSCPYHLLCKI